MAVDLKWYLKARVSVQLQSPHSCPLKSLNATSAAHELSIAPFSFVEKEDAIFPSMEDGTASQNKSTPVPELIAVCPMSVFCFLKTVLHSDNGLSYTEGDLASPFLGAGCVERCMDNICKGLALRCLLAAVMNELPC